MNDNISAVRNRSSASLESHFYYDINFVGFVFCVNPGSQATALSSDGIPGNHVAQNDEASSLMLRPTTSVPCF